MTDTTRRATPIGNPEQYARRVGEACDRAWAAAHADTRLNAPLSVLAALSLLGQRDPDGPDLTAQLLDMDRDGLIEFLRAVWRSVASGRADLIPALFPLVEWLFTDVPDKIRAGVWDVAQAALKAGIIALTGTDARYEVDALGVMWTIMLPAATRTADAKYYTPAPLAELMAQMVGLPEPGQTVNEPACGTGGFFRAMAWRMRHAGKDPASVIWIGQDVDELAIACCAVSSLAWGLGPNVILAVGNTLTDPREPVERAIAMRRECLDLAEQMRDTAAVIAAIRRAEALLNLAEDDAHKPTQPG